MSDDFRIKKNGSWQTPYGEVTHPGVKKYFSSILRKENKEYVLDDGRQQVKVKVEDTPFYVEAIREKEGKIFLVINDGTIEELNPETLKIMPDNSFVCLIKGGKIPAKFTLSAYWQIVEHVTEKEDGFYLKIKDKFYKLEGTG